MGEYAEIHYIRKIPKNDLKLYEGYLKWEIIKKAHRKYFDVLFIDEKKMQQSPELYADLKPYLCPLTVKMYFTDYEGIKRDFNIPMRAVDLGSSYWGNHRTTYRFYYDKSYEADVKDDRKYESIIDTKMYVAYIMEGFSDRKEYEIQKVFHDNIKGIKNNGYYKISKEVFSLVSRLDNRVNSLTFVDNTREGLFYLERDKR